MEPLSFRLWSLGAVFCFWTADFFLRGHALSATSICNRGIAFGIHLPTFSLFFLLFVLNTLFFWFWFWETNRWLNLGFLALWAGGLGNFLDRLFSGCVRDYISLPFFPIFPTFNLSDIVISLGVVLLAVGFTRARTPHRGFSEER